MVGWIDYVVKSDDALWSWVKCRVLCSCVVTVNPSCSHVCVSCAGLLVVIAPPPALLWGRRTGGMMIAKKRKRRRWSPFRSRVWKWPLKHCGEFRHLALWFITFQFLISGGHGWQNRGWDWDDEDDGICFLWHHQGEGAQWLLCIVQPQGGVVSNE